MKNIILEKNSTMEVTVVSNYFLDEYMPKANGEYVKIYLYLLRCCSNLANISISNIADVFEYTEKDVMRALSYWEQIGLLALGFDAQNHLERIILKEVRVDTPVTFRYVPPKADEDTIILSNEEDSMEVVTPHLSAELSKVVADATSDYDAKRIKEKRPFTPDELKSFTQDEDIKTLLYICQTYLGKTLSAQDTTTILYFIDGLGFSSELIEFLIEYCVSNNHKTMRYIEKVALDWASEDISTVEEAKNRVSMFSSSYYPILNAFGISGRNPAAIERAMIDKWINEYHFDTDIIVDACNRTIATIQKPSFKYADSILQRWLKKGVTSLSDIKNLDSEHETLAAKSTHETKVKSTTFNSFPQRTYDYDALERDLLRRK